MKLPVTVTVHREFGNSGDVITTLVDAHGETQHLAVPGDCSPYQALSVLRPFLEGAINSAIPADPAAETLPPPAPSAPEVTA